MKRLSLIFLTTVLFSIVPSPALAAPDYETDFSTATAWTANDSAKINIDTITNQRLDFVAVRDTTVDAGVIDLQNGSILGSDISNTAYVIRFTFNISSFVAGNNLNKSVFIGTSSLDQTSDHQDGGGDGLFFRASVSNSGNLYSFFSIDGGSVDVTTNFARTPSVELIYIEMTRLSSTSYKLAQYSDSSFSTLLESTTQTIVSTNSNHRYFKVTNDQASSQTGSLTGYIDNLQICNNTADFDDCLPSLPNDVTYLRTVPGHDYMLLEWEFNNTAATAEGFIIQRMTVMEGSWSTLTSDTGSSDQSYVDTALSLDTWYNYRVKAFNGTTNSTNWSNESNNYTLEDPNMCLIPGTIWIN